MILSHRTLPWKRTDCNSSHCLPYCFMQSFCQSSITLIVKKGCSSRTSCVSVWAHCLWFCHWIWLGVFLSLLYTLPSNINLHWWMFPEPTLLHAEQPQVSGPSSGLCSLSTSLSYCGAKNWSQHSKCVSPVLSSKDKLPWPTGNS